MSVWTKLGLGERLSKRDWPYPPVSAPGPVPLSLIQAMTWSIGNPRELHRSGRRWDYDRYNTPLISSNGEYPVVMNPHYYQTPSASLTNADVRYLLTQPQNTIPNNAPT